MNKNWKATGLAAMTLLIASVAHADSPVGVWSINANGFTGTLNITGMDTMGGIVGRLSFDASPGRLDQIQGFWTDSAHKLVFYRASNLTAIPPDSIQVYTGYLLPASITVPNGPQRLAGSFEAFAVAGGSAARNVFGWFAQKP